MLEEKIIASILTYSILAWKAAQAVSESMLTMNNWIGIWI